MAAFVQRDQVHHVGRIVGIPRHPGMFGAQGQAAAHAASIAEMTKRFGDVEKIKQIILG